MLSMQCVGRHSVSEVASLTPRIVERKVCWFIHAIRIIALKQRRCSLSDECMVPKFSWN